MNNDDLKKLLAHPTAPALDDGARSRIVSTAVNRYREARPAPTPESAASAATRSRAMLKSALALAACLMVIVTIRMTDAPDDGMHLGSDQYNVAAFSEYRSLFQHELRALVAHNGDVDVLLGGHETAQRNPVVFIRIEAGGKPVYITAFSGQSIEAEIGGRRVTMEILTTAEQGVVLAADEFVLEDGVLHGPKNLRADARVVETRL